MAALAPTRPSRDPEAGTGLIGTTAGATAFLVLLLYAVQVTVHLSAASTITSAGYDAARLVASRVVDHRDPAAVAEAERAAEERFHGLVGSAAATAVLSWTVDAAAVHLRVRVRTPGVLPRGLGRLAGLEAIDRSFTVRIEEIR